MESKLFKNKIFLRIDKGEEIIESIKKTCRQYNVKLATLTGIGATNKFTIGLFETGTKKYISKEFIGDFEIAPLMGNITTMNGEIYVHAHANIAGVALKSYAGHLNSALVSATFECIIDVSDGEVDRLFSNEIGLNLMKFN